MYPENIYIKNHEEIVKLTDGKGIDVGIAKFDNIHGLEHDDLLQAQYSHWRAKATNTPELLSVADRALLGLEPDWFENN